MSSQLDCWSTLELFRESPGGLDFSFNPRRVYQVRKFKENKSGLWVFSYAPVSRWGCYPPEAEADETYRAYLRIRGCDPGYDDLVAAQYPISIFDGVNLLDGVLPVKGLTSTVVDFVTVFSMEVPHEPEYSEV